MMQEVSGRAGSSAVEADDFQDPHGLVGVGSCGVVCRQGRGCGGIDFTEGTAVASGHLPKCVQVIRSATSPFFYSMTMRFFELNHHYVQPNTGRWVPSTHTLTLVASPVCPNANWPSGPRQHSLRFFRVFLTTVGPDAYRLWAICRITCPSRITGTGLSTSLTMTQTSSSAQAKLAVESPRKRNRAWWRSTCQPYRSRL